ncbi:uncharacterized protein LOC100159565 [Acyrthosiphon pisum]|uniref:glycerol kinase n=1 Tax=Acyrthosiphon pisum TaxID=7029 RepID=A0A8R2A907_ACYPI|nr:uncharacterized protein LOC100159565 [Acyrthosiphon pisum]|eukprot:XP_003243336.1 PREDICTED: glycerol kinase-like [Acyrthosiphon pisum]
MMNEQLIGVIDVESEIVKFSILNHSGNIVLDSYRHIKLIKPYPGWVEVDAENIWNALCATINEVIVKLELKNLSKDNIKIIGIINERDTVLAWDLESSKPLCNAIHYTDTRTDTIIQDCILNCPKELDDIEDATGSKVTSMFSGIKLKWIINNTHIIQHPTTMKNIKFGTLDTWIVWKLTKGNLYVTDITNASRTLLMNLKTLEWSLDACRFFNVPISLLPTIKSSSEHYGTIEETPLKGISIGSIFADHQAALYGLHFDKPGQIMSNYGDSCTVSCIIGTEFKRSNNGLITTVAYKIDKEPAVYAFEGWTSVGGKAIEWLKNNMKIVDSDKEIESLNIDASDVYFVPAFNGLAAPHWKPDARGIICGMTHFTNKKHIIRAALEAFCFHTKDVCVAFEKDTNIVPSQLFVDGLYSIYNNILSYQADILGVDVMSSQMTDDMAIYGSAKAAARVLNISLGSHQWSLNILKPTTTEEEQKNRYSKWLKAIRRSTGVSKPQQHCQTINKYNNFSSNFLSTAYLMAMMGMMVFSDKN